MMMRNFIPFVGAKNFPLLRAVWHIGIFNISMYVHR